MGACCSCGGGPAAEVRTIGDGAEVVDLSGTRLRRAAVEHLSRTLDSLDAADDHLRALLLSWTSLGDGGAALLRNSLQTCRRLEYLVLVGNGITDAGVDSIADIIRGSPSLKVCSVAENSVTVQGFERLVAAAAASDTLEELRAGGNRIEIRNAREGALLLAPLLAARHDHRWYVDLRGNGIEPVVLRAMAAQLCGEGSDDVTPPPAGDAAAPEMTSAEADASSETTADCPDPEEDECYESPPTQPPEMSPPGTSGSPVPQSGAEAAPSSDDLQFSFATAGVCPLPARHVDPVPAAPVDVDLTSLGAAECLDLTQPGLHPLGTDVRDVPVPRRGGRRVSLGSRRSVPGLPADESSGCIVTTPDHEDSPHRHRRSLALSEPLSLASSEPVDEPVDVPVSPEPFA